MEKNTIKNINCPILVQKIAITCKLLAINIKTYTKYSTYDSMHLKTYMGLNVFNKGGKFIFAY